MYDGCLVYRGQPYPKVIMESGQELLVIFAWWKDEAHCEQFNTLYAETN